MGKAFWRKGIKGKGCAHTAHLRNVKNHHLSEVQIVALQDTEWKHFNYSIQKRELFSELKGEKQKSPNFLEENIYLFFFNKNKNLRFKWFRKEYQSNSLWRNHWKREVHFGWNLLLSQKETQYATAAGTHFVVLVCAFLSTVSCAWVLASFSELIHFIISYSFLLKAFLVNSGKTIAVSFTFQKQ